MDELDTAVVAEGDASAAVTDAAKKPKARSAPKWETEARDRLRAAIRRFSKPLADLVARDANEGDTRLLVTDFLCDGLGFDEYADLTTEYQVKGEFADYGLRIDRELVAFIEVKRVATKLSTRHLRQVEWWTAGLVFGLVAGWPTSPRSPWIPGAAMPAPWSPHWAMPPWSWTTSTPSSWPTPWSTRSAGGPSRPSSATAAASMTRCPASASCC